MNKLALLAAAALAATSFSVAGAMAQAGGTDDFAKVDANKDGSVDMTEATGVYTTLTQDLFTKADANGDGKLDETEFAALVGLLGALPGATTSSSAPADASSSSAAQ
jgi:EF hand domain-containing protein